MSDTEDGFHPWTRLVRRLGQISPPRQVLLLCVISVATVALLVTVVRGSLAPTHHALQTSSDSLVPAIDRLDLTRERYVAASSAIQDTTGADPAVRAAGISQASVMNSSGASAWQDYRKIAAGLLGERALQRTFESDRQAALDAGVALISEPVPSAAGLARLASAANALRIDLNRIRALYEAKIQRSLSGASAEVDRAQHQMALVSGAALIVLLVAFGVAARSARAREDRLQALDHALHEDAERNALEAGLQRSLEMAHTEEAAYALAGRALSGAVPGVPVELLVADSSRAHFHQTTATDSGGPGCPVTTPADCPAATWGQTQIWSSSTALDACPLLQNRPGECSAVCVPVSIGGNTVGIVHAVTPDGHPPEERSVEKIELIARKVGERVGMLRAFSRSETQAHTDPLTGLMNRRSLEAGVRDLTAEGAYYVAAYGDLDFFKQLNDVHGHEAGDRALRLFSRVLRDTVRPNDLVGRYGGEEFVAVLPNCALPNAFTVVDRIRSRLAASLKGGTVPTFTVSFGLAASQPGFTFSETLEIADAALLDAKAKGRDRVVVGGAGESEDSTSATGAALPELTEPKQP